MLDRIYASNYFSFGALQSVSENVLNVKRLMISQLFIIM